MNQKTSMQKSPVAKIINYCLAFDTAVLLAVAWVAARILSFRREVKAYSDFIAPPPPRGIYDQGALKPDFTLWSFDFAGNWAGLYVGGFFRGFLVMSLIMIPQIYFIERKHPQTYR